MTAQRSRTLSDHLSALRRRRLPMLCVVFAGLCIAAAAAVLWPPTFRSTGTILIEQQELPSDLVRSTISSFADQRIQVITQRVMTTENLFRIIQRYDLYPKLRKNSPREALIARMRADVGFEMISASVIDPRQGTPTKATIAFAVSFSSPSADTAARVANELVSLYLQENMTSRKQHSVDATTFLTEEAERLSKRIAELGEKVSTFKEQNANNLPQLMELNLQLMNRSSDEMQEIDTRVRSLDQQIVYLDAQLAQLSPVSQVYTSTGERVLSPGDRLKYLRTEFARASALYSPGHPDVVRLRTEIAGLEKTVGATDTFNEQERQLQDAESELASARERYGATHPDIVRLEQLVAGLKAQTASSGAHDPATPTAVDQPDNPAFIQVKAQREVSSSERAALQVKRKEVDARMRDFEKRLASTPAVEREYSVLVRELDNTQIRYQEVRQKQMEAQQSQNLEEGRKGERFTLIEPPLVPQAPASPNRAAIVVLGAVFSLGAGIAVVALLEMLDKSLRGKADVEALLSVAPLAVLPWIETSAERAARARARWFSFAGAGAAVVIAVALAHFLYRPLDVLWEVALRRLVG